MFDLSITKLAQAKRVNKVGLSGQKRGLDFFSSLSGNVLSEFHGERFDIRVTYTIGNTHEPHR